MKRFIGKWNHPIRLLGIGLLAAAQLALLLTQPSVSQAAGYDWLQFGFDQQHSGNNPLETTLNASNVSGLKKLFQVQLPTNTIPPAIDNIADDTPVYLSTVAVGGSQKDLVFLTTMPGDIIALDAHTGVQVWRHQNGVANCVDSTPQPCFTTASPAIDPNRAFVYSYGVDGKVHKYQVATGDEVLTGGWPEVTTIKPTLEKGSASLAIGGQGFGSSYLYVANGGFIGDRGDYQGHLTTINLATGAQAVFNTLCSNQTVHLATQPSTPNCGSAESAIWARPGAIYDPDTGKVYVATGNGPYDPSSFSWGDSVLTLHPDGTGAGDGNPVDSYTPTDQQQLDDSDTDLGSTAPAVLPVNNGHHYAVQGGKDQMLRLINLDDLSGKGKPGQIGGEFGLITVPQGGLIFSQPAVWRNPKDGKVWVFVGTDRGLAGVSLNANGNDWDSAAVWTDTDQPCTSPVVANSVLFCAGSNYIRAVDPTTGAELWHDTAIGSIHWESPIVVNGTLYITDGNQQLTAYALPNA